MMKDTTTSWVERWRLFAPALRFSYRNFVIFARQTRCGELDWGENPNPRKAINVENDRKIREAKAEFGNAIVLLTDDDAIQELIFNYLNKIQYCLGNQLKDD